MGGSRRATFCSSSECGRTSLGDSDWCPHITGNSKTCLVLQTAAILKTDRLMRLCSRLKEPNYNKGRSTVDFMPLHLPHTEFCFGNNSECYRSDHYVTRIGNSSREP